jgi:succinate dehydrogenase / fumarate reductase iron-sulfur subunit
MAHLGLLPQGQPERSRRALSMVAQMDREGFGNCSWHGECQEACPKSISLDTIARMNRDWLVASIAPPERLRTEEAEAETS